ncbi:MAG: DUF4041 domain-containing protein, partial [Cetobacterium sp.]
NENKSLEKYKEMKLTKEEAQKQAEELILEAKNTLNTAREKSKELNKNSNEIMTSALKKANEIELEAIEKAKKIAGTAYDIKGKADFYEDVAIAMQNKIAGYGDEYLKPTHSFIDDLANEYYFIEIGKDLKIQREIIKKMVVEGIAASCDYVQVSRAKTACEFVLDAFNGKVESILSRVKHTNYGKLEQEIIDACRLVNFNGVAFRSARIEKTYLDARLKELDLLVKIYLYKEEEKEEQKRIREEIKEEVKAQKEYEKSIKDAEAEEKRNQKALEQAKKQYEEIMKNQSEQEREKFALKIEELQKKLEEAQKNKERTISQAQLTRSGHVYIISNIGAFGENVYKIGLTRRLDPLERIKELGGASVPFPFDVHAMIYSEDAPTLEKMIHRQFNDRSTNLVNLRKEFFTIELEEVREFIIKNHGEFKLTKLAEATQYRETIKMREQNIKPLYTEDDIDDNLEEINE